MAALLLVTATSRGDVDTAPAPSLPTEPIPEPITGKPAVTAPGSESTPHDPFTPYSTGGPEAEWKYSDLTPAEQAVAARGLVTTGWNKVHNAFAAATAQRSHAAAAASAAAQLGVDNLPATGVVP